MGTYDVLVKEDFTILVVDDEIEVVKENSYLIENEGYNVIPISSGLKAIEIIKNNKIDVLVIDYFMPETTGEEVITEIRKFNKEIVILLQTGYAGRKPPLEILENLNIQGYHDKTEGPKKLLIWVMACVRVSNLMRENAKMLEKMQQAGKKLIGQEQTTDLANCITALEELVNKYRQAINDEGVTSVEHHKIATDMGECIGRMKR